MVRNVGRWLWLVLVSVGLLVALVGPAAGQEATPPPPLTEEEEAGADDIAASVPLTVVEIGPAADTYIASGLPTRNSGTTSSLFLGYDISAGKQYQAQRILLRFDLSGRFPANTIINSARLRLYMNESVPSNDATMEDTELRQLNSAWGETTATWANQPLWGPVRARADIGSAPGWYEWDVKELVTDWVRGTVTNNGLEIIGDERVQDRQRLFWAREGQVGRTPRLVIDYSPGDSLPPIVNVSTLPLYSQRTFLVSWSGADQGTAGIDYFDVQYRVDQGNWIDWLTRAPATTTSSQFAGEDGHLYEFRARGVDRVGNIEPWAGAEAQTTVDVSPPRTTVNALPAILATQSILVSWSGSDGERGSGIRCYDVQYRYEGGNWVTWQSCVAATSATFQATLGDGLYEFEARAVDNLGYIEPYTNQREAALLLDSQAPFLAPRIRLPLILRGN